MYISDHYYKSKYFGVIYHDFCPIYKVAFFFLSRVVYWFKREVKEIKSDQFDKLRKTKRSCVHFVLVWDV